MGSNDNVSISRWSSSSTSSGLDLLEKDSGHLPPKAYPRPRMTITLRAKFVGYTIAMIVIIAMPLTSLGFVRGSFPLPLWTLVEHYDYDPDRTIGVVPVWNCLDSGYLSGGEWTFLGIDLRFGRMSFGQAKLLDMVWNWAVGRGLQFALAWLTYHVFTSALMRTAEVVHVPYELFTSLALFSARPETLWDIFKGLLSVPGLRVKLILGWLLFSTVYLVSFPSLLDVMSGYEGSIRTELVLPNQTQVDLTGLTSLEGLLYYLPEQKRGHGYSLGDCQFYDQMLNASWQTYLRSDAYHDNSDHSSTDFYTLDPKNYNCVAEQGIYQWGFSGEWVLLVICVNGLWIFGLWILWLDTEMKSQLTRVGRRMGTYRAIADISEAMREDLGGNLCAYSNHELKKALKRQGKVKYYANTAEIGDAGRIGLSSRMSEKLSLQWGTNYG